MEAILAKTSVWIDKPLYNEAERKYLEKQSKGNSFCAASKKSSLVGEVAKARERIKESLKNVECNGNVDNVHGESDQEKRIRVVENTLAFLKQDLKDLRGTVSSIENVVKQLEAQLSVAACARK